MDSLQLDPNKLNPEQERLPQQLLEKCAALSVRPNAIKDLVDSMGGMLIWQPDLKNVCWGRGLMVWYWYWRILMLLCPNLP